MYNEYRVVIRQLVTNIVYKIFHIEIDFLFKFIDIDLAKSNKQYSILSTGTISECPNVQ